MDTDALKQLFQKLISESLPDGRIISVDVLRDVDSDGDDVLNVTVVFDAKSDLDAATVAGLTRHLRPHLEELGEKSFPFMSFISEKEARKKGVEAA